VGETLSNDEEPSDALKVITKILYILCCIGIVVGPLAGIMA